MEYKRYYVRFLMNDVYEVVMIVKPLLDKETMDICKF